MRDATFDARLERVLGRYGDSAVREIDSIAIAGAAIRSGSRENQGAASLGRLRWLLLAAALAVFSLIAYALLAGGSAPRLGLVSTATPGATETQASRPGASPGPTRVAFVGPTFGYESPRPLVYLSGTGPLPAVRVTDGFSPGFMFDLSENKALPAFGGPEAWGSWAAGPHAYEILYDTADVGIDAYSSARIYADICHHARGFVPLAANATPEQVIAALATVRGLVVEATRPITIDGHDGLAVDFHNTPLGDALDCDDPGLARILNADPGIDEEYSVAVGPDQGFSSGCCVVNARPVTAATAGVASRWYVIDIDSTPLIFEAWTTWFGGDSTFEKLDDFNLVIAQITFP